MTSSFAVDCILFDMDGTLLDSLPGVLKAWGILAKEYSFDASAALKVAHGRPLRDSIKEFCRLENDAAKLKEEIDRVEALIVDGGLIPLPGVHSLVAQLNTRQDFPWTIVTSATREYVPIALNTCGINIPRLGYVAAGDVSCGKPHPDPYLAGAKMCGVDPADCLVVEDAPSGMKSGKAAGAKVLALLTTYSREQILESGAAPDYIVKDLSRVAIQWTGTKATVVIDESVD